MKSLSLLLIALAAGILPAADPTPKEAARAKAALALAFAEVPPAATPKADTPQATAAKAALKAAFGFACDCPDCADPCPRKCGCEACGCNDRFPRPMEPAVPPKVEPVEKETPKVAAKPAVKEVAVVKYRTEYRTHETGRLVRQCNGNGTCSWVPETVTEAVQVPVTDGGQ